MRLEPALGTRLAGVVEVRQELPFGIELAHRPDIDDFLE
jgi:hypothetical protein